MYDELVKRLRELQTITEHCDEQSCDECENRELCDKHDNKTLSGTYREAADAIEELQKCLDGVEADNDSLCKTIAELSAIREEQKAQIILMAAEDKLRWIPVTERLPEAERKSYWVCTDTGYQCECRWTNNRFGIGELDEWGWSIFDIPQYQKVVAWMPLPKPYEPPKEET